MTEIAPANRKKTGRFAAGSSGNPSGRPRDTEGIGSLARLYCPAALERLVALLGHADGRVALAAAEAILTRGLGKPADSIELAKARRMAAPGPLLGLRVFGDDPGTADL
jgi:hypothetical protein